MPRETVLVKNTNSGVQGAGGEATFSSMHLVIYIGNWLLIKKKKKNQYLKVAVGRVIRHIQTMSSKQLATDIHKSQNVTDTREQQLQAPSKTPKGQFP